MKQMSICTALAFLIASTALCDDIPRNSSVVMKDQLNASDIHLTGNLRADFFGQRNLVEVLEMEEQVEEPGSRPYKSPWLAAGMSLVLPGSGEFYANNYWRSALLFAVEVTAWTIAYTYDKKGDRQTDSFEKYADGNWNVYEYAQHAETIAGGGYEWRIMGTEGRPPWERVNWSELNRMEQAIGRMPNSGYSHTLPLHGEQQYYELIGKYYQYNQGWQDVALIPGQEGELNQYYERERAHADDFYQTASTMVSVALVNHLLSAVDAVLCATSFNKVHASVGHKRVPDGPRFVLTPIVKLSYDL